MISYAEAAPLVVATLRWMAGASADPRARTRYATPSAAALTLASGHVESAGTYRWQRQGGPAVGFLQAEPLTIADRIEHDAELRALLSRLELLDALRRDPRSLALSEVGQVVFFRRLLYARAGTLPELATTADEEAYRCYLAAQRPGKPHPEAFKAGWRDAVPVVAALWPVEASPA